MSTETTPKDQAPPSYRTRAMMRGCARLMLAVLTQTTVSGLENLPDHGPLLILANHTSTIDPLLLMTFLPTAAEVVGPGDFDLRFPGELIARWYGLVRIKRSLPLDRASLKLMTDMLKAGKMPGLFPDGGVWEKPITDAKSGVAYLSMTTGTPILPVGIGGAYQAWDKVIRLKRPRLLVNIGAVIPPVPLPDGKSKRGQVFEAAAQTIMQRIYDLLPRKDRARYDDLARRCYDVAVDVWWNNIAEMISLPGSAVLGEIMLKPDLMSPLIHNAGLPLDPLRYHGVRFPAESVRLAATVLRHALHESFTGYMEYRLGEAKARELDAALSALALLATKPGVTGITLTPTSHIGKG